MGLWQGSDGKWLATAPTQRKQWPDFCKAIGREDLSDPTLVFKTRGVETIMDELRALFATKPRDEWVDAMVENKVPAAPCTSYAELAEHPQVRANNYIVEVDHPDFPKGKHRVVGIPTCAKQRLSCSIRRRPCYLNLRGCQQNFLRFSRRHSGRGAQAGPAHRGGTGGAGLQQLGDHAPGGRPRDNGADTAASSLRKAARRCAVLTTERLVGCCRLTLGCSDTDFGLASHRLLAVLHGAPNLKATARPSARNR